MSFTAVDIGAECDFVAGTPQRVEVGGRALVIVRTGERIFALRDICSHKGARLSEGVLSGTTLPCKPGEEICYGRQGEIIRCPWHGWEFDIESGVACADNNDVVGWLRGHGRSFVGMVGTGMVAWDTTRGKGGALL